MQKVFWGKIIVSLPIQQENKELLYFKNSFLENEGMDLFASNYTVLQFGPEYHKSL